MKQNRIPNRNSRIALWFVLLPISLSLSLSFHFVPDIEIRVLVYLELCVYDGEKLILFVPYSCFNIKHTDKLHKKPTGCSNHVVVPVTRTKWQETNWIHTKNGRVSKTKASDRRTQSNNYTEELIRSFYRCFVGFVQSELKNIHSLYENATMNDSMKFQNHSGVLTQCLYLWMCKDNKTTIE